MQENGISLMVAVYSKVYQEPKHCDSQNPETLRNCADRISEKKPRAFSLSALSETWSLGMLYDILIKDTLNDFFKEVVYVRFP